MGISLLKDEQIIKKTHPHFLSMLYLYVTWGYLTAVGLLFIFYQREITSWIGDLPFTQAGNLPLFAYFALWAAVILIPSLVVSFKRINWSWGFLAIALIGSGIASFWYRQEIIPQAFFESTVALEIQAHLVQLVPSFPLDKFWQREQIHNILLIAIGIFGIISSDAYRRSHRYYLTDRRLVAHFGFVSSSERDLLYSKVDDLIVQQSFIGRLLGFGTIIPISASGIGTGSDQVFAFVGGEGKLPMGPTMSVSLGGGKSVTIPRAPSFYSLYGVARPDRLKNIMIQEMEKREYGYTRRILKKEKS